MTTLKLYTSVVSCPLSCDGIIRDSDTYIPQGFFTMAKLGDEIRVLVVGQNPGQPHSQTQTNLYSGCSPTQAAHEHLRFVEKCFFKGWGTRFHKRLLDWLCDLLQVPPDKVFHQVVYTNLVKCCTPENKIPSRDLVLTCYAQHLRREIDTWQPLVVVGLGTTTCAAVRRLGIEAHSLPHPSHRKHADYHRPYLEASRRALERHR